MSVAVVVGPGQDNRTMDICTDETSLAIHLKDGRKFSTQLYSEVVPGATSVTYKGQKCIVRLQKKEPNLQWPQLEVCVMIVIVIVAIMINGLLILEICSPR